MNQMLLEGTLFIDVISNNFDSLEESWFFMLQYVPFDALENALNTNSVQIIIPIIFFFISFTCQY